VTVTRLLAAAPLTSAGLGWYTTMRAGGWPARAKVAQLVEHGTENAGVGGSIPPLGTSSINLSARDWSLPGAPLAGRAVCVGA
jgi:hypothetical protein